MTGPGTIRRWLCGIVAALAWYAFAVFTMSF